MPITATLKFVLRELPETRESNGLVFMALQTNRRDYPKASAWTVARCISPHRVKQWKTACTRAEQIRATGTPALLIVEAHVSTKEGALMGVVKGVQVVEGKARGALRVEGRNASMLRHWLSAGCTLPLDVQRAK